MTKILTIEFDEAEQKWLEIYRNRIDILNELDAEISDLKPKLLNEHSGSEQKFIEESRPIKIRGYKFYKRELESGVCEFDNEQSDSIVKGLGLCITHLVDLWEQTSD